MPLVVRDDNIPNSIVISQEEGSEIKPQYKEPKSPPVRAKEKPKLTMMRADAGEQDGSQSPPKLSNQTSHDSSGKLNAVLLQQLEMSVPQIPACDIPSPGIMQE